MAYFATPYNFINVMAFLGEQIDGNPYTYDFIGPTPIDSASYAANISWTDSRTQPTWAYVSPTGDGFAAYDANYQATTPTYCGQIDTMASALTALIPAAQVASDWSVSTGVARILNKPSLSTVATSGSYTDLSGKPALVAVATSGSYSDLTGKPTLSAVAASGAYSDLSGKPALSTVATSGNYNDLSNKPATALARSVSVVSRSLSTAFQVSTTRDAMVNYSVSSTVTLTITGGQSNQISLQISSDGTTYTEQARYVNSNTGALTIGLSLAQTGTGIVSCYVPAGYYVKLVPSGTGTNSYVTGQEVLM